MKTGMLSRARLTKAIQRLCNTTKGHQARALACARESEMEDSWTVFVPDRIHLEPCIENHGEFRLERAYPHAFDHWFEEWGNERDPGTPEPDPDETDEPMSRRIEGAVPLHTHYREWPIRRPYSRWVAALAVAIGTGWLGWRDTSLLLNVCPSVSDGVAKGFFAFRSTTQECLAHAVRSDGEHGRPPPPNSPNFAGDCLPGRHTTIKRQHSRTPR